MAITISIITATIDEADALNYAIQSVVGQTYPYVEHIVVDGFSTDHTAEVVAGYPKVKLLRRERRGVYDALNYGISKSTGDVIGLVHGNDALSTSEILARVALEFENNPELDFVYGDLQYVDPATHKPVRKYHAEQFRPDMIPDGICPPHPTLYILRKAAERIGEYSINYPNAADFEMWLRLFADKSLSYKYLPITMVDMSTGGSSASLKARLLTNNLEKLRALRANGYPANPIRLFKKHIIVIRDFISDKLNGKKKNKT